MIHRINMNLWDDIYNFPADTVVNGGFRMYIPDINLFGTPNRVEDDNYFEMYAFCIDYGIKKNPKYKKKFFGWVHQENVAVLMPERYRRR